MKSLALLIILYLNSTRKNIIFGASKNINCSNEQLFYFGLKSLKCDYPLSFQLEGTLFRLKLYKPDDVTNVTNVFIGYYYLCIYSCYVLFVF